MAGKSTTLQTNFTAGEISPRIYGRPDISKYQNGAKRIENGMPTIHGGIPRRGGFHFVYPTRYLGPACRLVPFVFSRDQAYMLEFGDYYMRVFKDRGRVLSGPTDSYTIPTPYSAAQLADLDYCQGKDTMFMFHPDVPIQRLRRFDHDYWDLSDAPFLFEPFDEIGTLPASDISLSDASIGTGRTATSVSAVFLQSDVGRTITSDAGLFKITAFVSSTSLTGEVVIPFKGTAIASGNWRLTDSPQGIVTPSITTPIGGTITLTGTDDTWRAEDVEKFVKINSGLVQITVFTDAKHVTGVIVKELSAIVAAPASAWTLSGKIWNEVDGYPRTGTLYQQRLVVAGSPGYPQRYIMSVVAESLNFTLGTDDNDGFAYDIEADEANPIAYMTSIRTLLALTYGSEFTIDGGIEKPITPTNPQVRPRSNVGCGRVRPVRIKNEELFVQRSGLNVHALSYNTANDDYLSPDLTTLAEHITESGIVDMAYQQRPNSTLWCVRADGVLATLTIERDQEVVAWSRQITDGLVESVASIPGPGGDELWLIVKRYVNGNEVRFVEYYDESIMVDAGVIGDGPSATVWGGFDHLEGRDIDIVAEGAYFGQFTVTGGSVTLPRAVENIQGGLHYTTTIEMLDPEVLGGEGSAQGNLMLTSEILLRFKDTFGATVNGTELFGIGTLGEAPTLFSGLKSSRQGGWNKGSSPIVITQDVPLPFHLLNVIRKFTVNQQ